MAKKDDAKPEGEAASADVADSPLLDLSDAGVKRFIKPAKTRGFVTLDELNAVLPSEEVILRSNRRHLRHGHRNEHQRGRGRGGRGGRGRGRPRRGGGARVRRTDEARAVARRRDPQSEPADCTDDPGARICARWARWSFSRARARSPSPSASRPAARRYRRPLREPPDLRGHHRLARRAALGAVCKLLLREIIDLEADLRRPRRRNVAPRGEAERSRRTPRRPPPRRATRRPGST